MFSKPFAASLLILTLLMQTTPVTPQAWVLASQGLQPVSLPTDAAPILPPAQDDLDDDGQPETLTLAEGRAAILSGGEATWQSPEPWDVAQAALADLNHDGEPEAALLVWRLFQPWPVDRWLPHGGRISDFHDADGRSCHIILIGWQYSRYKELWAGSALAEPVAAFAAADLDGDGDQELVTLEGDYASVSSSPAHALKVWEWNGFGFSAVSSVDGAFHQLILAQDSSGQIFIFTP